MLDQYKHLFQFNNICMNTNTKCFTYMLMFERSFMNGGWLHLISLHDLKSTNDVRTC